ncbi:MAG: phosphoglycerate dehydrogenase [Bacteroidetes bacterium]|nr:phosphoglycerate dehydrogenase [Bacteroidota bacterium]
MLTTGIPPHVLVIDHYQDSLPAGLSALGVPCTYLPQCSPEEALEALPEASVLVLRSKLSLDARMLGTAPRLRLVIRTGAGTDHLDTRAMAAAGVQLLTMPQANRDAVGEHALALLLCLANHLCVANAQVRAGQWLRAANTGTEIGGKTVGIIGYGNTGGAFARKLGGLGCQVLAYDKYRRNYSDAWAREASLEEIQAQADVLSLHVPLTPETRHMAGDAFFNAFRKPLFFLNLSRGPVTDTAALLRALEAGKVQAAGLDVLENERLDRLSPAEQAQLDSLCSYEQVVLTPHVAGWSHEAEARYVSYTLQYLREWLAQADDSPV